MVRNFFAVVLGIFCGMIMIGGVELASTKIFPLPDSLPPTPDFTDPEQRQILSDHIAQLPVEAMALVLAGHALGVFLGATAASALSKRMAPSMLIGAFFLAGGIMTLMNIPGHPLWFGVADLALYLPMAYFGALIFARAPEDQVEGEPDSEAEPDPEAGQDDGGDVDE